MLSPMSKGKGKGKDLLLQISQEEIVTREWEVHEMMKKLLEEFEGVFDRPKGLSPSRSHDHKIIIKEGTHQFQFDLIGIHITKMPK